MHGAMILISFLFSFVQDYVIMALLPSLCRIMKSCRRVAWPSRLHCPLADPTKARARTPLTSTSALWRCCRSVGLSPFPRNYWPTWRKGEGQISALSAPTGWDSRGLDLPTTLQGRRPLCEHERGLWHCVYMNLVGWNLKCISRCATKISRVEDF